MDDVNAFLDKIAKIESNSGTNFAHKEIKLGPQKGQTAIGTYGLLPNTVDEIISRSKDPELSNLSTMTPQEQKAYLETHPQEERRVAEHLAEHVLAKQGGDQEKAAYAWLHGHNLSPEKIEKKDYQSSDYVKKFNKISGMINPISKKAELMPPSLGLPRALAPTTLPPLDIGGTAEGDKVQSYMDAPLDLVTMINSTAVPVIEQMQKTRPVNNSFNKIQTYLAPKVTQPTIEELMANQPKNPELLETLKKIRGN